MRSVQSDDNSESLSLFAESEVATFAPPDDRLTMVTGDFHAVRGLSYFPEFITCGEERVLIWEADREGDWSTHWSRRTKSFGASYLQGADGKQRPPIPEWATFIGKRLVDRGITAHLPNQMGVNEYVPGQGISAHVDYFGGTVVSLSLGSACIMEFDLPDSEQPTVSIWLPRRSIVVLQGEARNIWRHGIRGRKKDVVDGHTIMRDRRISLTLRDVT
jgi:alkylated DNA repair dioxygenase AlkB